MTTLSPIVAAVLVDSLASPTQFFAASRAYPEALRGQFELPGGKIEDGEKPTDALVREITEELGVTITLGHHLCQPDGSWWPLNNGRTMGVWLAHITSGSLTLGDSHLEGLWLPLTSKALDIPWIEADRPIIHALLSLTRATE